MGFRQIGIVGLTNMSILFMLTIWKTASLIVTSGRHSIQTDSSCRKRIVLQLLLVVSVACDLPIMTIYDWSAVLYDIKEIDHRPLFFRRNSLIAITVLMFISSAVNFVYMYTTSGVDSYINSPLYVVNIFLQVASGMFLTGMMLSAGVRLSVRIRGVCGELREGMTTDKDMSAVRGLQSAVNRLNSVMFVCFICILVQVILLMLNYALGYSNNAGKSVGPQYFYWTFYFWVPVWGPVLSLMYLGRSSFHKRDVLSDTDVLSPLNDTSYGGSARMTASMRKTLSNSIASGDGRNSNTMGNTYVPEDEPRAKVYRPPDYPSALFSRDSAYDDGGLEGSGTNGSFDAPLSSILPLHGAIDSSTLVDYYDAFLLNSPENHRSYPQVSIDTSATSTSASEMFPSHPSMTTDTSTLG